MRKVIIRIGSVFIIFCLAMPGSVNSQRRLVDRKEEAKRFAELLKTEKLQEGNIIAANKRLAEFWYLVALAKTDRLAKFQEEYVDRQKFENTFRKLKYTPRNTYTRYVADVEVQKNNVRNNFILAGLGSMEDINQQLQDRLKEAQGQGVKASKITFNQNRIGIELTQFEFTYGYIGQKRLPLGSKRKSVALYFKKGGAGGKLTLDMTVVKVVHDELDKGLKYVQVVIDPSPLDDNMDDIIIYDRYNQKPAYVSILGMMNNTTNNPHRLRFKQGFYSKVLSHFFRLFRMVDSYAKTGGEGYDEGVLEQLERSLSY